MVPAMEKREDTAIRIEKLEFLVAHLQKSFDELNMVVFTQQREIDQLRRAANRMEEGYRGLLEADRAPRSLTDDRPPHY
jgi:uncharacterized coiled-coil protein SlyX